MSREKIVAELRRLGIPLEVFGTSAIAFEDGKDHCVHVLQKIDQ